MRAPSFFRTLDPRMKTNHRMQTNPALLPKAGLHTCVFRDHGCLWHRRLLRPVPHHSRRADCARRAPSEREGRKRESVNRCLRVPGAAWHTDGCLQRLSSFPLCIEPQYSKGAFLARVAARAPYTKFSIGRYRARASAWDCLGSVSPGEECDTHPPHTKRRPICVETITKGGAGFARQL